MNNTQSAERVLRQAYPKALSYTDIWTGVLGGSPSREALKNMHGGNALKTLVKQGKVKQICPGFYCHTGV